MNECPWNGVDLEDLISTLVTKFLRTFRIMFRLSALSVHDPDFAATLKAADAAWEKSIRNIWDMKPMAPRPADERDAEFEMYQIARLGE